MGCGIYIETKRMTYLSGLEGDYEVTNYIVSMKQKRQFTVASFDAGIKNLAFCVMQKDGTKYNVIEWKNIDLTTDADTTNRLCDGVIKSKKDENGNPQRCTKQSKVKSDDKYYCTIHNPDKGSEPKATTVSVNKKEKAGSLPLQDLCVILAKTLDCFAELWLKVDHIVIEKQYSKNRKMICLSDMLYSYFVLRHIMNPDSRVEQIKFIHAKHKLEVYTGPKIIPKRKGAKAQRKELAIEHCRKIICDDETSLQFLNKFPKKKDDLSDCFLQGAWYLSNRR